MLLLIHLFLHMVMHFIELPSDLFASSEYRNHELRDKTNQQVPEDEIKYKSHTPKLGYSKHHNPYNLLNGFFIQILNFFPERVL